MRSSSYIDQAKVIISSVRGKKQTLEGRRENAIDLSVLLLQEARRIQSYKERNAQMQLARMVKDPNGKNFTTEMTDQCFRSINNRRAADQIKYLIDKNGIPKFLPFFKRLSLKFFQIFGSTLPALSVPLVKFFIRKETEQVVISADEKKFKNYLEKRKNENIVLNINHLGEAILGEKEALSRLNIYINDLANPDIKYISVKISTIFSQINLLAQDQTIDILSERLRELYRAVLKNPLSVNGKTLFKFVNLDMEEYKDLYLTVDVFKKVLSEPEFIALPAGIVLQSYLPDSYLIQQELTQWALKRVEAKGAPIKIRIVKGANLAMEQVDASLKGWELAPFTTKVEVDANFKRMLHYGLKKEHAKAVIIGVGSHNLFDIAYAMLLAFENEVETFISFEMLEGMADHIRRVVQDFFKEIVLYCPTAKDQEFQYAIAYLVRRLDENTAPNNFLRHSFDLIPGTKAWQKQSSLFSMACRSINSISAEPRRKQNRLANQISSCCTYFANEPDTDWSLTTNQVWAKQIIDNAKQLKVRDIPLVINGKEEISIDGEFGAGFDPSNPQKLFYRYALANSEQIDLVVDSSLEAFFIWSSTTLDERSTIIKKLACLLQEHRAQFIEAMLTDTGKTILEADTEVSEAIDFANYYRFIMNEIVLLSDVDLKPKGVVLVTPPWNFPCSIAAGGIIAALITGNTVIFKPAPEAVLVGWTLVNLFWKAGVSKSALQFINCIDETTGSQLIKNKKISTVVLTGATETAKLFYQMKPGIDLIAETGGKNCIIVTNMADRDLAIKDIVQSAFGFTGQKCSACSLVICEAEVYDDPHFLSQLVDAVSSLKVDSAWNLATKVNPLIKAPNATLYNALTTLEEGEEWLLKPNCHPNNPNLWSPGIKKGVKPGSVTHTVEFFGPILGIIRAENLKEAIEIANLTPYGLTSGLHSLDQREQTFWLDHIEAGNCYINRGITGAVVQRQPFGGFKASSFGPGLKAGGPNYLFQFLHVQQKSNPIQKETLRAELVELSRMAKETLDLEDGMTIETAIANYEYFWKHYFSKEHDPSQILGQDNILKYVPQKNLWIRIEDLDDLKDIYLIIAACIVCKCPVQLSFDKNLSLKKFDFNVFSKLHVRFESKKEFLENIIHIKNVRVRFINSPSVDILDTLAKQGISVIVEKPCANGRIELLKYLREVSISRDYHRYGNLGDREAEERVPAILGTLPSSCGVNCNCSRKSDGNI